MVHVQTAAKGINGNESIVPANSDVRPPLRRIAIKTKLKYVWEITEHCPSFEGSTDPLANIRQAVEDGSMVMFTRKIAPFHFELWARARW